jgi:hypothetical protein
VVTPAYAILGSSDPRPKAPGLIRVRPSSPDQPPFMTTILKFEG